MELICKLRITKTQTSGLSEVPLNSQFSLELQMLRTENITLRCNLARKYSQTKKLQKKLDKLKKLLPHDSDTDSLESQSGNTSTGETEPGLSVELPTSTNTEQITAFADEDAGWKTDIHSGLDPTFDAVATSDSSLGEFLKRPIRADAREWAVGQPLDYFIKPWQVFQSNPTVADKLGNYELLRYKLNMKIVISGTGFHYGRAIVAYNPMSGFDDLSADHADLEDAHIVGFSQKPHIWLNPSTNEGGEMEMPFFWKDNYLSLSNGDAALMGQLNVKSIGNLLHANGGTDPVTVTMYLWATDIVLTMPSSLTTPAQQMQVLNSQSGRQKGNGNNRKKTNSNAMNTDEYGQGIISKPATAIAKAAGLLEQIPFIRPYARATQMLASGVGGAARLFGFSRPSVLTDIEPFKPNPTGNLANVDAADAVHKLTLDSKQELTIDSRTVGLDGTDQMGLTDIACRESYLTSFEWTEADLTDTMLWNAYVTPNLFNTSGIEIHPTPMAMIGQMFKCWKGSVKFRFQVVKSQYHKGRVLLRYDPTSHTEQVNYNVNYSRVVDISEEDDFEIVIGWAQAKAFLNNYTRMNVNNVNYSDSARLPADNILSMNGILEVNVLNNLVSPSDDNSPIKINVFVSMCDDAKFAFPNSENLRNLHYFPPVSPEPAEFNLPVDEGILISQSGVINEASSKPDMPNGASSLQTIGEQAPAVDHNFEVFFGEAPVSLRDLFKRYIKTQTVFPDPPGQDIYRLTQYREKVFPAYSGWDPQGPHISEVDGSTRLNTGQTTFLNFMAPCYAGWRGNLRRKFVYHAGDKPSLLQPTVSVFAEGPPEINNKDLPFFAPNNQIRKWLSHTWNQWAAAGSTTTNIGINNTIEVEFPFYKKERFAHTRVIRRDLLDGINYQHAVTSYSQEEPGLARDATATTTFDEYVATGEDFSLFFFTGAPVLYNYTVNEFS